MEPASNVAGAVEDAKPGTAFDVGEGAGWVWPVLPVLPLLQMKTIERPNERRQPVGCRRGVDQFW
jgi:hypothetical protein